MGLIWVPLLRLMVGLALLRLQVKWIASIFSGANAILLVSPYSKIRLTCFSAFRVLSSRVFLVASTAISSAYPHLLGSPLTSLYRYSI